MSSPPDRLLATLTASFGHAGFRPGQRAVVEAVAAGRDTMVVMPTGGGKSLCYQLPAVVDGRSTLVVSPLIALMKDQVDALIQRGIPAAALHSNLDADTQREVVGAWRQGRLRLLYVAPERLTRPDFLAMLAQAPASRLVVDEAHCISEWGHDFRRDYLRIGEVVERLDGVQLVACTATATPEVRDDIIARLGLRDPELVVHGFDRPNLHLSVERCRNEVAKLERLEALLDPGDGRAIVYAGTRVRAAALATRLAALHPTMLYHGDLDADTRRGAQERFASGEVRVAVTTSAFGMGVDVADVRQVIHVALPGSLEEYYQQAGRAGRDGKPARCVLLHAPADRRLQEFFIECANPEAATILGVHRSMLRLGRDPGAWRLVADREPVVATLPDAAGDAARELLRDAGGVTRTGEVIDLRPAALDHGRIAANRRTSYRRFERLLTYLRGNGCRHRLILEHFGEDAGGLVCGGCDICAGGASVEPQRLDSTPIRQALSAVARLNGRVGVAKLAGVLVGSGSRAVAAIPGATALSTFGALAGWRETDVVELLRRLLDAGALAQTAPPYATVVLTPLGIEVMRDARPLTISDPRPARTSGNPGGVPALPHGVDHELLGRLRAWRTRQAKTRGVPAYVVLPDRTLAELASRRPVDDAALLTVPGIGPGKLAAYGPELLELVTPAGSGVVR
ncbi:MAG: RecQ family ATP-dependent DNA helicase [Candidatus Dormibacteria bacterium]